MIQAQIGDGSVITARSVVAGDVPRTLAADAPAQHGELPDQLRGGGR